LTGPPRAAAKAIVTIAERTVDVLDYLTMGEFCVTFWKRNGTAPLVDPIPLACDLKIHPCSK
jgi:hypothetical protein